MDAEYRDVIITKIANNRCITFISRSPWPNGFVSTRNVIEISESFFVYVIT
jgi:hypothetical protein